MTLCLSLTTVNSYLIEKDKRKSLTQPANDSAAPHTSCVQENNGMSQNLITFHTSAASMSSHQIVANEGSSHSSKISVNVSGSLNWVLCEIDDILRNGRLLLHGSSSKETSLELPKEFWGSGDRVELSEMLCQQIEQDLQW